MAWHNVIRNTAFKIVDGLKGHKIKKDIDDIKHLLSLDSFRSLNKEQLPRLTSLLHTATKNSNFYKKYEQFSSLNDFPVVNKKIIKDNFSSFTTNLGNHSKFTLVKTSGSTGTPFKIYQTQRKKDRNTADTIYFAKTSGFTIGDKLLYLRLWSDYYKKRKILAKLQNVEQVDVTDLTDAYISKLIRELENDKSPKGWLGYASGYEKICRYLDKKNSRPLNCNVKSIIAMSEALSPYAKSKMEYYFGVPTVSRYSNVENGILAQQVANSDNFVINWASYYVEILDLNKDIPAKDGEIGRIVVTDLFNTATFMIRYDTGDLGAFYKKDKADGIPMLKSVQGRRMDVLNDTEGKLVDPFKIQAYCVEFQELDQMQIVQTSKTDYTIVINSSSHFIREADLLELFKKDMGIDANITVKYVDKIPVLSSGKRKLTMNLSLSNA